MGYSYQDIESRLRTVESKLDLLMNTARVTKREPAITMPGHFIETTMTLLDLWREIQTKNLAVRPATEGELIEDGHAINATE